MSVCVGGGWEGGMAPLTLPDPLLKTTRVQVSATLCVRHEEA